MSFWSFSCFDNEHFVVRFAFHSSNYSRRSHFLNVLASTLFTRNARVVEHVRFPFVVHDVSVHEPYDGTLLVVRPVRVLVSSRTPDVGLSSLVVVEATDDLFRFNLCSYVIPYDKVLAVVLVVGVLVVVSVEDTVASECVLNPFSLAAARFTMNHD